MSGTFNEIWRPWDDRERTQQLGFYMAAVSVVEEPTAKLNGGMVTASATVRASLVYDAPNGKTICAQEREPIAPASLLAWQPVPSPEKEI